MRLAWHGGGLGSFGSAFVFLPGTGFAACALFNHPAGHGLDLGTILLELLGNPSTKANADPLGPVWSDPVEGAFLCEAGGVASIQTNKGGLELLRKGKRTPLQPSPGGLWIGAPQGGPPITVGFPEHPTGGEQHIAVNDTPIVIGALPYRVTFVLGVHQRQGGAATPRPAPACAVAPDPRGARCVPRSSTVAASARGLAAY